MKRVLIVGSNRGIGLEYVKQYKNNAYEVIAACRIASPELKALDVEVIEGIDIGKEETIRLLQNSLQGRKLDLIVNNAGIMRKESLDHLNYKTIEEQFRVNTLGPIRVTTMLLSNLKQGSKVAMMTSRMGSIKDNTSGGAYGYRMSKCALNIASKSLAYDLSPKGISIAILHPGYVRTDMTDNNGFIDVTESVNGLIKVIDRLDIHNSGTFWHSNGEELPW